MDAAEVDLKAILAILHRQRRLLLATAAIILCLASAYLLTATRSYTSTVLIQVDGRTSNLLDPSSTANEQSAILNSRVDSEVEILRSDATALAVLQAADLLSDEEFGPQLGLLTRLGIVLDIDLDGNGLRRIFGLAPAPQAKPEALVNETLTRLQDSVDVRRRGLTYLIAISVSSASPERAAELANTYARVYIDRQVTTKTQSALSARDVLRRQIDTAQQELAASETAINTFIENNLDRLETETGDATVTALRARLNAAKDAQAENRARIATAETALSAADWQTVATTLGDEALLELARQREELRARIGAIEPGADTAIDLQAEIAALDRDLSARSQESLGLLRKDGTDLSQQEGAARDELRTLLLGSDLSADTLASLFNLQQRATAARDQYQTLIEREQDVGALANLQIADARIVSEALPANEPSAPKTRLNKAIPNASSMKRRWNG